MVQRDSGLSRGYGFLSYSSPAEAQSAIANMDGFKVSMILIKKESDLSLDEQIARQETPQGAAEERR